MSPVVGEWSLIGPTRIDDGRGATGVLFSIAIETNDPGTIYVASPFCGVWKSADGGASWRVVGDSLPTEAVAALATDPSTPGRVYALLQGPLLYRSDNGATTWVPVGAGPADTIPAVTDLIVDPSTPQVLHLRASGACWRSGDGGQTWQATLSVNATTLVLDSTNPAVVYVGDPSAGVFRATDGGVSGNWTLLTPSISVSGVYDVKIAVTRADAQTIYARFQKHGEADVYRSQDGGATWEMRSTQAIYTELIAVDDANPAIVYVAGVDLYRSDDGGASWTIKPGAHADHHKLVADPTNPAVIYTCCDGGLYRSPDRGDSWAFVGDGLANVLFYDLAVSATRPEIAIGGTQDNGTILYDGSSPVWKEIMGGDGATVAIDPTNANIMYGMDQYASSIAQSTDGGGSFHNIAAGLPTGSVCFNLRYQVHSTSPNILLACCQSLWRTTQPGTSWSALFTPPGPASDNVVCSAVDPSTDIYYAATDQGRLFAGPSGAGWQLVFSHPNGARFRDLVIDPDDTTVLFAAFGASAGGRVYRLRRVAAPPASLQATDVTSNLPTSLSVQTIAIDAMNAFTAYAGTNRGVFRGQSHTAHGIPVWSAYSNGMPAADIRALRVQPSTGVMRTATFGRSAYEVYTDFPVGSLVETVGHITFLRAHDVGTGYGRPPNFLDCEVIVLLAEQPQRAFGFKLRADSEEPTRTQMLDLLRAAFVAKRPVRIDYVKTGPRVGEIVRVANS